MIRLTWRQFRAQAATAAGPLVIALVVLAVTGPHLAHLYDTSVGTCRAGDDCSDITAAFLRHDRRLRSVLDILVLVVPGVVGVFWGAPLVAREIESGTFRLAWTQSVTRTRWLAVKVGLVGLAAMATAGLLSLMTTWWAGPLDRATANAYGTFGQRDIVPVGYAAFAFVLGVTAGILIRRTVPAMLVALVGFVVTRVAVTTWVRPRLFSPRHRALALDPVSTGFGWSGSAGPFRGSGTATLQPDTPHIPNAWISSTRIVDRSGHGLTSQVLRAACPGLGQDHPAPSGGAVRGPVPEGVAQTLQNCVTKVGGTYHEVVTYQPASRYWTFQWAELGIYLAGAAALGLVCLWAVRRRA